MKQEILTEKHLERLGFTCVANEKYMLCLSGNSR